MSQTSQPIEPNALAEKTDTQGRTLGLKAITWVERMRLMRVCGPAADVDRYFGHVLLAACVRSIDGAPVLFPSTIERVEGLVDRLGDAGLQCVAAWLQGQAPAPFDVAAAGN